MFTNETKNTECTHTIDHSIIGKQRMVFINPTRTFYVVSLELTSSILPFISYYKFLTFILQINDEFATYLHKSPDVNIGKLDEYNIPYKTFSKAKKL